MAKRKSYKKYYTSSSNAYDILDSAVKIPSKIKKVKAKEITKYKYQINKKSKFSFLTYFIIFIIFAGCVITISLNAQMSYLTLQINAKYDEFREVEEENLLLRSQLSSAYDLSNIEKIASERLGMSRPQSHQIIKIDIKKGDSDGYGDAIYDMPYGEPKKGFVDAIVEFFTTVF